MQGSPATPLADEESPLADDESPRPSLVAAWVAIFISGTDEAPGTADEGVGAGVLERGRSDVLDISMCCK